MNATVLEFLTAVYGSTEGIAHLAIGVGGHFTDEDRYAHKGWNQSVFRWPDEADSLARAIGQESAAGHDVYVCPYLTHGRQRAKGAAVERTKVHADLDGDAVPLDLLDDLDAYAVDSGTPGHAHVYVALDKPVPAHWHELLCRGLGAFLGDADAKIADNDVLRPVGTFSQKNTARGGEPTPVQWLRKPTGRRWTPEDLAARLGVTLPHRHAPTAVSGPVTGPAAVVENVDPATLPDRVRDALAEVTGDRSADTMRIVGACHDAGLTLAQARGVIALRTDLAARLAKRRDDDVLTCWLKATDSRASRRADAQWLAGLPHAGGTNVPPEQGHGSGEGDVFEGPALQVVRADTVTIRRVVYHWAGRMPLGAVTLLPGEEGIGKSTVGARIMADTTRGLLDGEHYGTPRDVVVIAIEDGLEDVAVPRLREAGADLTRVHFVRARYALDGNALDVVLPRDLPAIGELVAEHDVALVWVDSLVTTLPDELKTISYKDTAKVLRALGSWAEEHRVVVAAPWHLNKGSGSDTAVRIMDSRAFRTAVRSMLLVVADPDAPEGETAGIVALDKSNAGTLNVAGLRYRIRSARYVVDEVDDETGEVIQRPASCGVAQWTGEVDGDARQVARDALAPRIEKVGGPREWLRTYLTEEGEANRADVIAAARDDGFSVDAIKRAARAIGVHSRDESGRDDKTGRPWRRAVWSLPDKSVHTTSQSVHSPPTAPTAPTGEGSIAPNQSISAGHPQSVQSVQCGMGAPTGKQVHQLGEHPPPLDDTRPRCRVCDRAMGRADAPHGVCIQCRRIATANAKAAAS